MTRMNGRKVARILTKTLSGLLAVGLAAATAAPALGQAAGTWTTTGSMSGPSLTNYTATLLQNGQVLVAGGFNSAAGQVYATAFLYNPSTGAWTETGSMTTPRYEHEATLLQNGEVLVTGGVNVGVLPGGATGSKALISAELYNPSTGTWSKTAGSMVVARYNHSSVLLQNGDVLVAGGHCHTAYCENIDGVESAADLYNPSANSFSAAASMHYGRASVQLTLLQNGEALIAGGGDGVDAASCSAELFSIGHGWSLTSNLAQCAAETFAALLPSGDVLIEDGNTASEFYVPSTNVWQATSNQPNVLGPLAPLTSGDVLVVGSALVSGGSNAALYDPSTNEWTPTAASPIGAETLTPLLNGQVLATEGNSAALFTP